MSNQLSKSERERDAANQTYFITLAESRASLGGLSGLAFINAALMSLLTFTIVASMAFYVGSRSFLFLYFAHLAVLGFSAVVFLVSLVRPLTFRFQVFFSSLLAVFATLLVYTLCLMGLGMITNVTRGGYTMFDLAVFPVVAVIGLLYVCGATVVHVLLLRKRLREGHSEARTWGNLVAASSVYNSKSLWTIFGAVMIVPNVLTQGQYLWNMFGVAAFLLFATVTPSLPVEFTYLAYLKSRDRRYWEHRPGRRVRSKGEVRAIVKKVALWVGIVFAFCVVMLVLTKLGMSDSR
ncbi:hypothetical protein [Leifsonia shinshuensis]|uniref:Glucan phosphoethanolaminetransferase (Alkaline phosphatase superfamily) n=1 Tax=Leifsonia shinshuensis TaxID=150026 RepID=A0A853CTF3_9MICO|nr:hypothetical protein [Leifsonia shinshuensis]NYJ23203.1 glucan phosphoethanolaminetransferase (alkaline phosphatase superfamily) [Leifsonia shinshuensis]